VGAKIHMVSKAVRELRTALGETQQEFAFRVKTAIRTIARWETVQPPRGDTLKGLAYLAEKSGRLDLATVFDKARVAELAADPFTDHGKMTVNRCPDGSNVAYLVHWFNGNEEIEYANRFHDAIAAIQHEDVSPQRRDLCRAALKQFAEQVKQLERL
jgi:transcriptional regulator with XRE-family HTH domain